MTNHELKNGQTFTFSNDEFELEVLFKEPEPKANWTSPFQAWFNGKLFGFKTFKGLQNKVNALVQKFNLKYETNPII